MHSETDVGYNRAVNGSDGLDDDKNWYKLDDFATADGLCNSIDAMYSLLLEQKKSLNSLKYKLESLLNSIDSSNPSCGDITCGIAKYLIDIKSDNISVLAAQIQTVDTQIVIIDHQIEMLCYIKPDNMYFRRK